MKILIKETQKQLDFVQPFENYVIHCTIEILVCITFKVLSKYCQERIVEGGGGGGVIVKTYAPNRLQALEGANI